MVIGSNPIGPTIKSTFKNQLTNGLCDNYYDSDRSSKPSISPFGWIMPRFLSIDWVVLISVAIKAGIENSLDTIARWEHIPPFLQTIPASLGRIGARVVVPASSTTAILPAAPSFQRLITSWIEFIILSSPWTDFFKVIFPLPMTLMACPSLECDILYSV